jgi:hypothetical protein
MLHFIYWNTHVDKFHDFVEDVERWNIRWALVDGKPGRLPETLHVTNPDLNNQYLLTMQVSSATSKKSFHCNETREILLTVYYGRWTTVQFITYAYTQTCASRLGYDYWWLCQQKKSASWLFINLYKWKTMNNSCRIKDQKVAYIYHTCILLSFSALKFRRV